MDVTVTDDNAVDEPTLTRPTSTSAQTTPVRRSRLAALRDYQHGLLGFVAVVAVITFWEIGADASWVNVEFTSSPSRIISSARQYFASGDAWPDLSTSFREYGIGIAIAIAVSVPLGVCIGWYKWISGITNPFISFLNATPLIALAPLFVIWFGLGISSKVALVILGTTVPILVTTSAGVRSVDQTLLKVPRTFEATQLQLLRTLVIPASFPSILAGIRLATGFGLIMMIIGEIIASTQGLGYMISAAGNTFDTDRLFVGIAIVAITGMVLTELVRLLERYFDRWRL